MNWLDAWAADLRRTAHDTIHNRLALEPHQIPPTGDWEGWVLLAGRGAGKSYAGMHWLNNICETEPGLRARVIAPTFGDGVASCVEGPNGLLLASRHTAKFRPSEPGGSVVVYPNGSRVWIVGTHTPLDVDRLRALTNIEVDVFEEAFANRMLQEAWDQAAFSRRRGTPRFVVTSTPRPHQLIKEWATDTDVRFSKATTRDNPHLSPEWVARQERKYKGTRLYRQEFLGEVLEDVEGALWTLADLERSTVTHAQAMEVCTRFVVGVDPPAGAGTCGIIVMGRDPQGHIYLLDDYSLTDVTPHRWALAVATASADYGALVVAEVNQGGRMVREVLKQAAPNLAISEVHASKGKRTRAEPIANGWEADEQVAHMAGKKGELVEITDQLTSWVPGTFSPDRVDAMVWAATHLLKYSAAEPDVADEIAAMTLPGI